MSFVLIHGAGMGASCWDPLLPLLEGDTLAVDLPGRGRRRSADPRSVTLADCTAAVVEDVEAANLEDIVLVAHSFAGVTATPAMPRSRADCGTSSSSPPSSRPTARECSTRSTRTSAPQ